MRRLASSLDPAMEKVQSDESKTIGCLARYDFLRFSVRFNNRTFDNTPMIIALYRYQITHKIIYQYYLFKLYCSEKCW